MTILNFFSLLFYLSLFLYDDIGRGQLNMQLNKSDDDDEDDDGGDGGDEEVEGRKRRRMETRRRRRGGVTD